MESVKICHFKTFRAGNFAFGSFCCFFLHYTVYMLRRFVCEDILAEYEFESEKFKGGTHRLKTKQDACTGVHSACRREENGHNLDICVLRCLRLRQGQMQGFLSLKVGGGGGLKLQIWDLNRAHETERTVFPILQVFSMCRRKL